jgi:hypothetical protein
MKKGSNTCTSSDQGVIASISARNRSRRVCLRLALYSNSEKLFCRMSLLT